MLPLEKSQECLLGAGVDDLNPFPNKGIQRNGDTKKKKKETQVKMTRDVCEWKGFGDAESTIVTRKGWLEWESSGLERTPYLTKKGERRDMWADLKQLHFEHLTKMEFA